MPGSISSVRSGDIGVKNGPSVCRMVGVSLSRHSGVGLSGCCASAVSRVSRLGRAGRQYASSREIGHDAMFAPNGGGIMFASAARRAAIRPRNSFIAIEKLAMPASGSLPAAPCANTERNNRVGLALRRIELVT